MASVEIRHWRLAGLVLLTVTLAVMKFNIVRALVVLAAVLPQLSEAMEQHVLLEPPRADQRFTSLVVPRFESASAYLRPKAFAKVLASVERHQCPPDSATLFRQDGRRPTVLLVPCHPSGNPPQRDLHEGYYAYLEYPIAFVIDGDHVAEADLYKHGFLYNSGAVSAITDIDNNGMPEFWLSGEVCGEDDGAQCDGNGLKALEFKSARLRSWTPPGKRLRE